MSRVGSGNFQPSPLRARKDRSAGGSHVTMLLSEPTVDPLALRAVEHQQLLTGEGVETLDPKLKCNTETETAPSGAVKHTWKTKCDALRRSVSCSSQLQCCTASQNFGPAIMS